MGGRGTSSGVGGSSRSFHHLSEANDFFGVGRDSGMFPDWERNTPDDEKKSAILYTTDAYKAMNALLRGGEAGYQKWLASHHDHYFHGDAALIREHAARIERAMDKFNLTENITVWRGGSNKLVGGASTIEEVKALIGRTVRDDGVTSAAVTKNGAWGQSGKNIGYEIEVPKGRGRGIFIDPVSDAKGEQEFMLRPGSSYKITGAYTDTHGNVICKMRVITTKKRK